MIPVEVIRGDSPVILGLPHTGTYVPPEIMARLNARGQALADTDWHIDRLYDGLLDGVTTVRATFHRYVIDANRDPGGQSLYPGQNTTGLVPLTDFDGQDIWTDPPDQAEIAARRADFHTPYHAALKAEIARVQALHGVAVLYDCHSIRSHIPYLFDGELPLFNIGTNDGVTCAPAMAQSVEQICRDSGLGPVVVNGRFKGGWTTRHYADPAQNIHTIQMELGQRGYLTEEAPPWGYDEAKASRLRPVLATLLSDLARLALQEKG